MKQNQLFLSFGRQVGWVIAANIAIMVIGIIQMPILTKGLGPALYGIWSLIIVAISLITPFAMLSFNVSIIRFLAAEKDTKKIKEDFYSACALVLISGTIFSVLLFLFSDILASYIFKDAEASSAIRLSSALVLLNSLLPVLLAFFRRGTEVGTYNILKVGVQAVELALIVLFIWSGYQLTGAILAVILAASLLNIIAIGIIIKHMGFQRPRFINMKAYLKWGIPLTPNLAILWIIHASDRYIISYHLGVSAAGIYSAAYSIGTAASFALIPLGIVLYPYVSRTYDEGKLDQCRNYFAYSIKYLMMISIPAAFGLSVLAVPLLKILTTADFISGASVVALLAFGALLNCLYQIVVYVLHLVGKTHITIRLLGLTAVLNIILNLILVPHLGILGAGTGSLIAYGVLGILTIAVTRRYFKFDLNILFIVKSVISSAIMALCIWLLKPESIIMVIVSIAVGIAIYFGVLILIKGFSKSELAFFYHFIKSQTLGIIRK